jgi:hypothetical protein
MDAPLPAVLQRMASLISLRVQLRQRTRLQADGISRPLAM